MKCWRSWIPYSWLKIQCERKVHQFLKFCQIKNKNLIHMSRVSDFFQYLIIAVCGLQLFISAECLQNCMVLCVASHFVGGRNLGIVLYLGMTYSINQDMTPWSAHHVVLHLHSPKVFTHRMWLMACMGGISMCTAGLEVNWDKLRNLATQGLFPWR